MDVDAHPRAGALGDGAGQDLLRFAERRREVSEQRGVRVVDLQPQLLGQEPAHRRHDPFSGATAANIDIAVVGIPAETVAPSLQFFIEIVEHDIA